MGGRVNEDIIGRHVTVIKRKCFGIAGIWREKGGRMESREL
jgi:hypothetical protein